MHNNTVATAGSDSSIAEGGEAAIEAIIEAADVGCESIENSEISEITEVAGLGCAPVSCLAPETRSAVDSLRRIALWEARRMGLGDDDAHDCAMEMVLRAMQQLIQHAMQHNVAAVPVSPDLPTSNALVLRGDLPAEETDFWLRRCALNFVSNFRRGLLCRRRYEAACAADPAFGAGTPSPSPARRAVSAEDAAFSRLFHQDLHAACGQLPPAARALFERFHLHEDSIVEIALSSGRSENAVKQSVYRTRLQVRASLASRGHEPL